MRKTILAATLVLIVVAAASAGDVKIRLIKHYDDPNWRSGSNTRFSDDLVAKLEQELSGNQGKAALEYANCTFLNYLYSVLNDPNYKKIVDRIVAMNQYHLYIYLIDDKDGLTPIMQDFAGVCDYTESDGKRYAWLCGHYTPETAVKIGEHYAKAFYDAYSKSIGAQEAFGALAAVFLGEMMQTVNESPTYWYPNDLVLKPSEVQTRLAFTAHRMPASKYRKRSTGSAPQEGPYLTLMPNLRSASLRTMDIFLSACWSRSLLDVYEKMFWCDGIFRVENGSDTFKNISAHQDQDDGGGSDKYVGYYYTSFYENKNEMSSFILLKTLTENELFAGMALYYLGAYWPHEMDSKGNAAYGFELVLDAYNSVKDTDPTTEPGLLFNIIATMFKRIPAHNNAQEIRERRLFLIALLDYLSDYAGDRSALNYHLEQNVIPSTELQTLLNYYFGGGGQAGIRERLKSAAKKEDTVAAAVRVLANEFKRQYYLPAWK